MCMHVYNESYRKMDFLLCIKLGKKKDKATETERSVLLPRGHAFPL